MRMLVDLEFGQTAPLTCMSRLQHFHYEPFNPCLVAVSRLRFSAFQLVEALMEAASKQPLLMVDDRDVNTAVSRIPGRARIFKAELSARLPGRRLPLDTPAGK